MNEPTQLDPKRARIVAAAANVFCRYGFARTTMGDIAQEAGVSRPSVYTLYPGKDEIFAAVADAFTDSKLAAIRSGLVGHPTLHDKLLFACTTWSVDAFENLLANPDARDMMSLAFPSIRAGYARFGQLLADILRESADAQLEGQSADELARVIVFSIRGFKDTAQTGAEMENLIEILISAITCPVMDRSVN
ncbi:TetR/AcrR family transcriptional regulator [Burkholderia lata]|uniref:TetR/AcrR family transcriptional regulator n=1 Tax=Burkholderia lata (strain ATCC 17760 / DSM 23089 / LMG 22485 / NCIMB 9086 / R18194 / 383) TaxID=482957 RepID=UPI00158178EE|nr:TetR/AcrR family transcriptional regulator [Burkholderia lata]